LLGVDAASAAAATGRALRLRMLGTTAFVFVTFVLRAAFSTMFSVAYAFRSSADDSCPDICDECRNVYYLIAVWMSYTPEFQVLIVLVSSPVALLVALWGMTSNATLQLMKSSQREEVFSLKPVKSVLGK
jgi:L-asparagine transporter-like permease